MEKNNQSDSLSKKVRNLSHTKGKKMFFIPLQPFSCIFIDTNHQSEIEHAIWNTNLCQKVISSQSFIIIVDFSNRLLYTKMRSIQIKTKMYWNRIWPVILVWLVNIWSVKKITAYSSLQTDKNKFKYFLYFKYYKHKSEMHLKLYLKSTVTFFIKYHLYNKKKIFNKISSIFQ